MSIVRSRASLPLLLLLLAAACAPARGGGALSPVGTRVTNEAIALDRATMDSWAARLAAVQARTDGDGRLAYPVARAAAWLAYARDAYAWNPRDAAADAALAETRRIVVALEAGVTPDSAALPMLGAARARPDLWVELDRVRTSSAMHDAPVALAEAEVSLVRASHLASDAPGDASAARVRSEYERACELQLQVARAERSIASLRPAPAAVVALQGAPVAVAAEPSKPRGVQRVVHFALNSSQLAHASRATLDEVIAMLRSHPRANLVIEGFADSRGTRLHNRDLALRRADAVRRYLDVAALDLGRVQIAGLGADSSATGLVTPVGYARDRRVTLSFTGPDGQPLTVAGLEAVSIDHERDLQVEHGRATPRDAGRATMRGPAQSGSFPR